MAGREIQEFAKLLVRSVRDVSIQSCDRLLSPGAKSQAAVRWQRLGASSAIQAVIPDVVDETLFNLLHAIDEGAIRVKFVDTSGREVDLTRDGLGELAGSYEGSGGWRKLFADERYFDDYVEFEGGEKP